jgi:tetratricopeptide (TPR) repeat protein
MQLGRYDDSIDAYKSSLGGGDLAVAYNNLGVAYWRQWQQLRATKNSMSDSDFETATLRLLSEAQTAFLESYHRDRSNLTSLDSYVDVRYDGGSASAWQPELIQLLAKEESFDTLYSLGKIAWLEHDFDRAAQYFAHALRLNPDHKLLHYNYAYALAQTNQTNDAIAEYVEAIRHDPTFWEAHFNVGLLYMKGGDTQNAISHFDEVLRLNPDHPPTLLNLARLFIQSRNPGRARPYLQEALRIDPQNTEALNLWQRLGS